MTVRAGIVKGHQSGEQYAAQAMLRWFAIGASVWLLAGMATMIFANGLRFEQYVFLTQDAPVAAFLIGFLSLLKGRRRHRRRHGHRLGGPSLADVRLFPVT